MPHAEIERETETEASCHAQPRPVPGLVEVLDFRLARHFRSPLSDSSDSMASISSCQLCLCASPFNVLQIEDHSEAKRKTCVCVWGGDGGIGVRNYNIKRHLSFSQFLQK